MNAVFGDPKIWHQASQPGQPAGPNPASFFHIFSIFYLLFGALIIGYTVLNILSAVFLRKHRHRSFCLVVAGVNCLHLPLGTVLGVFSIIVLSRQSVIQLYSQDDRPFV